MARTAASGEPRRSAKWTARRDAIVDTSAPVFARRLPRHRHRGAVRRQRPRQGRLLPLHRVEGGAPRRDPRPRDGRGDARRRPRRRGRRLAVGPTGHAGRRAARRHPSLPRSRLGLPPRVPGAHRRTGRAVPRRAGGRTSAGSRRSCRLASKRGSSGRSTRGSRRSRGSACTTTRTCGSSRAAPCRRATSPSRSPTSSSGGSPLTVARATCQVGTGGREPQQPTQRAAEDGRPLGPGDIGELAGDQLRAAAGTCPPRAGSRCPRRWSTTR